MGIDQLAGDPNTSQSIYSNEQLTIYFTKDIPLGGDFLDVAQDRYIAAFNTGNICDADKEILLSSYWSQFTAVLQIPDGITFPTSLKNKLIKDDEMNTNFITFCCSYRIDMDQISNLKNKMDTLEERFFWQIFHRKYPVSSHRGFEQFPTPYRQIITHEIETSIQRFPNEPTFVLEMGCGPDGRALKDLKLIYGDKIDAHGINMEIYEGNTTDVHLKEGDIRSMPYDTDTFDVVYEVGMSGYFRAEDEKKTFIIEAMRVVKPGGKLLITDSVVNTSILDQLGIPYTVLMENPMLIVKNA